MWLGCGPIENPQSAPTESGKDGTISMLELHPKQKFGTDKTGKRRRGTALSRPSIHITGTAATCPVGYVVKAVKTVNKPGELSTRCYPAPTVS